MVDLVTDPGPEENPDVWMLFRHYDKLYFRGALIDAGVSVQWSSPRKKTISSFGSCSFGELSDTITLYEPMLQYRTNADLKNALLHLMIHGILYLKHGRKDLWNHGPIFRDWMDAINACSVEDHLRPPGGYCITTTHDFSPEKSCSIRGFLWKCESCGDTLVRATNLGPPSDSCCIENVDKDAICGNMLCHWHNHKMNCGGTYVVNKPPETPGQKKVLKGLRRLLTGTSEMSKPQGTVQDSDLQENATATKPNAEGKLLSLVGSRNATSLGSSSSKKAGNRNVPQHFQKTIVLPAAPLRKLKPKQEFVASEKHELFSIVSCNDVKSPGSSSSKKTGKWNMPGDFQKAIDLPAAPLRKQKPKQKFIASEKLELFTKGSFNDAKSPDSSTSRKAGKRNMPEDFQKAIVLPAAPQKKLKPKQEFVALEKHELFSTGSCNDAKSLGSGTSRKAGKWQKLEDFEKSSLSRAAPQKKLKLEQDLVALEKHGVFSLGGYSNAKPPGSSFSRNAGKWHKPEDVEKSSVPPAAPQKKLKLVQDLVASEKHGVAKPPGSSTASKVGKLHKPEGIQKARVLPDAPPRKQQDSVASEKNELFSFVSCSNAKVLDRISSKKAHKQREHEVKPIALPTAPQTILKQPNKTSSSIKAGKHHKPERFQKTIVQPALSQSKLEQSNRVAPERQKTRSKTRKFAREKEYAVISVWQNIYESEGSSGSTEPLVNKRTERRKRERERLVQITYSRSRKRSISGVSSIKTQPPEEVSSQQAKPPSPCLDIIVIDPADHVVTQTPVDQSQPPAPCLDIVFIPPADPVMTQAPGDQSQPPAPCSVATDQVVLLQSADPPGLIPSNPSSIPDVIDISDDD